MDDKKTIVFLGPAGTFSELAAKYWQEKLGGAELSYELLPNAIAERVTENTFGVLPYYHTGEGLHVQSLEAMVDNSLRVIDIHPVSINLSAGKYSGSKNLGTIYANKKVIERIKKWRKNIGFPTINEYVESTAASAQTVQDAKAGIAIADEKTLEKYGLDIFAKGIYKSATYFYLVCDRSHEVLPSKTDEYLTMLAVMPKTDTDAVLPEAMKDFFQEQAKKLKLVITKSWPNKESEWGKKTHMMYFEVARVESAIDIPIIIRDLTKPSQDNPFQEVRVLGSYANPTPLGKVGSSFIISPTKASIPKGMQ